VILVNAQTASAAEVLTSALRDNNRARVVGPDAHTFGKGVVQSIAEAKRGAVAVTIARYETPKHTDINQKGIEVDAVVSCAPGDAAEECVARSL
jgi:carboxyl-terminal processing protease